MSSFLFTRCKAACQVKTFIFSAVSQDDSNFYPQYAAEVKKALNNIEQNFPKLNLNDHVLIVVPDEDFSEHLLGPLRALLGSGFILMNAADAASQLSQTQEKGVVTQRLVLDTVKACDGLERLFCICVGLDCSSSSASQVRSSLYRGMTRAQLQTMIVNNFVEDGFLAFLGFLHSADTNDEKFSLEKTQVNYHFTLTALLLFDSYPVSLFCQLLTQLCSSRRFLTIPHWIKSCFRTKRRLRRTNLS